MTFPLTSKSLPDSLTSEVLSLVVSGSRVDNAFLIERQIIVKGYGWIHDEELHSQGTELLWTENYKHCSLILYPNDKTGSCTKQIIEENSDEYKFNQSRELF